MTASAGPANGGDGDPANVRPEPASAEAPAGLEPLHPALAAAWSVLDDGGIRWAILRGRADADEADIDLLIHHADLDRAERPLGDAGFVRLPAIGHAGHRFYRTYHEGSDRWLTLDVVSRLAFGPGAALRLDGAAEAALERRVTEETPVRLSPPDGFWALLLHDLLDRRGIPDDHATQLAGLAWAATSDDPIARAIDERGGMGTAARLLARVQDDDRAGAVAAGRRLARRWTRTHLLVIAARRVRHLGARLVRKPFTAVVRRGIDVAVLGPDGAGKSTIGAALATSFPVPTRTIYLGLYADGLAGAHRFGFARRLLRLWRGWLLGRWHRLRGRVVIYDRHALDARIGRARTSRKAALRRWILGHAIPTPDLVLILDAPGDLLFARKGEHDPVILEAQHQGYLALATRVRSAELVDATRPADDVRRDVTARTWRRLGHGYRHG